MKKKIVKSHQKLIKNMKKKTTIIIETAEKVTEVLGKLQEIYLKIVKKY